MSLVPDNVFADASTLRSTYQRLITLAGKAKEKNFYRKDRKQQGRVKQAGRELDLLDKDLLNKLTPKVLQQALVLVARSSVPLIEECALCSRVFKIAGSSVDSAKRLAHLFFQALNNSLDLSNEEVDWCYDSLLQCFNEGRWYSVYSLNKCLPSSYNTFLFLDQLIKAAERGDTTAHEYLRLLYRSVWIWRFDIQPTLATEFKEEQGAQHWQSLAVATGFDRQEAARVLPLPICYAPEHCTRLSLARSDELRSEAEQWDALEVFRRRIKAIPLVAYDNFLSVMWNFVCRQSTPKLVLSGARDKVEVKIPYLNYNGLKSFAFVRECAGQGFRPYPEVAVRLFFEQLCEHHVTDLTLDSEGKITGMERSSWFSQLLCVLWCVIVDAYAEIVVPVEKKNSPENPRRNHQRVLKAHRAEHEAVIVRPHFRKLPQGWEASQRQVEEAILATGAPPASGYTFVGECQRGFPGVALPYQQGQDAWGAHKLLKPSLVITEDHLTALLDQVSSFG